LHAASPDLDDVIRVYAVVAPLGAATAAYRVPPGIDSARFTTIGILCDRPQQGSTVGKGLAASFDASGGLVAP